MRRGSALARALLVTAAALVIISASPATATPTPTPTPTPTAVPVRALLDLRVNGMAQLEVAALLEDGDAWVAVEDLARAGLAKIGGTRRQEGDRALVSLRSLAPAVRFTVDERQLALAVTAGPEGLPRERVDFASSRPEGMLAGADPSAFVNYSVQATDQRQAGGFGEVGLAAGDALLWSGFSVPPGGTLQRGLTSATFEDPQRVRRFTAGDAAAALGGLGSSAVVGGLSLASDFALDPYLVQAPRPATSAFAASPSTLEVWVNGTLVRRQTVLPGTLDLANLPVVAGSNAVQTILRDAFGREQVLDQRAAFSPGLLAPGLADYAYHLGFLRDAFAGESFSYGAPALLARHRYGFTDSVTAGARLEATPDRGMAGALLTLGTVAGQLDLEAAGSVAAHAPGAAGSLALSWPGRLLSTGLRLRAASSRFATATLDPTADRPLADLTAFVSFPLSARVGIGLEASGARARDAGASGSLTARADVSLGYGLSLLASVTGSGWLAPGVNGLVMVAWAGGDARSVQATGGAGRGGSTGGLSAMKSLPAGEGIGYRVDASAAAGASRGGALLQAQTSYGRYEATVERTTTASSASGSAAGAVVLIGDRVLLSRPVEQSYALIRVPGVPSVRGYLENQEVGRTDGRGDLLVPALLPRYANRLGIRAADVPLDHDVGAAELLVAPPRKAGRVVRFDVEPIRAVAARLELEDGGPAPAQGEVAVAQGGETLRSPTSRDGAFFLERVASGTHEGEAVWGGGR
ncbi:MAG TPA: fimbria/pilus outer membrane usher protein, partial [Anaeromyxobacteraceae bacterium]